MRRLEPITGGNSQVPFDEPAPFGIGNPDGNCVKTTRRRIRRRDCLIRFFLLRHTRDELSLRRGCGADSVLSFELASGNRLASNFFVRRDNPILNHLSCLVVEWEHNIYVFTISLLSSRHKKKVAFLAVGEPKALNDKTVIYRDGCICLEVILIGGNDLNTCDFQ
jgi:hypothetical protein